MTATANTIGGASTTTTAPLPVANSIDGVLDLIPIYTASLAATQAISRNVFLNITSQPQGLNDVQSPTNKTFDNTNTLTIKDANLTIQNSSSTTKQAKFSAASITAGQTRTFTLPDKTTTLVGIDTTDTLTNKTITSPSITGGTIDNTTITVDTIAGHTAATTGTVYGMSVTTGVIASAALAGAVNAAAIASGAVTYTKIGTDSSFAYNSSFTPVLSTSTGTLTTASATCRYLQIGKTVFVTMTIIITTNGTGGGSILATLPLTAQASNGYAGSGRADGVSGRQLQAKLNTSSQIAIFNYDTSYPGANGEVLRMNLTYEVA